MRSVLLDFDLRFSHLSHLLYVHDLHPLCDIDAFASSAGHVNKVLKLRAHNIDVLSKHSCDFNCNRRTLNGVGGIGTS